MEKCIGISDTDKIEGLEGLEGLNILTPFIG
jgi:hypothetical protein